MRQYVRSLPSFTLRAAGLGRAAPWRHIWSETRFTQH